MTEDEEANINPSVLLARERVRRAWVKGFGKEPTPGAVEKIAQEAIDYEFDMELIEECIRRTALRGADDPVSYILTCLDDWTFRGIYTLEQFSDYMRRVRGQEARV